MTIGTPSLTSNSGNNAPVKPTSEPMDRSIPPVIITKQAPMANMPYKPVQRAMLIILPDCIKRGSIIPVMRKIAVNKRKIPRVFFIVSLLPVS